MKKVLIITYYWPPAGGIGVLRCLKFAKYLRNYGWEPMVYTAENAQYPYLDPDNETDIPPNLTVIKRPILEPFNMFKALTGRKKDAPMSNPLVARDKKPGALEKLAVWIRGNFFIPDARALWIRPSVRFLTRYLKENPVDALLSDGPPHTNTMIACKLSQKLGIPWLADFQDPWTQVDYYQLFKITPWADRIHKGQEQEVFQTAHKITIASPHWKEDLHSIGAKNVEVIFWGYDEDDFKALKPVGKQKFRILHAGILGLDRLPDKVFRALQRLCNEVPGFKADLQIDLYGMVDYSIKESIATHRLEDCTHYKGTIDRRSVLKEIINADLLLLPLNKSANILGRIPGKLFEYLRSFVPILCLGPAKSDVSQVIQELEAGETFGYDDAEGIRHFLYKNYLRFREGKENSIPRKDISKYSVAAQTQKIAHFLNEITLKTKS